MCEWVSVNLYCKETIYLVTSVLTSVCPGDGVRGGGCCANLPVFFSQNSGLVAVVARESVSILPETMEDSLCSSLAAAPEVKLNWQNQETRKCQDVEKS